MTDESGPPQATGSDVAADGGTEERSGNENGTGEDVAPTADEGATGGGSTTESIGLAGAKAAAVDAAEELIDHPIDSVIRIERDGDGWRTLVEVVERSAIPDTQDILGRYEIVVDDAGTLVKYGLEERYRRGENREEL